MDGFIKRIQTITCRRRSRGRREMEGMGEMGERDDDQSDEREVNDCRSGHVWKLTHTHSEKQRRERDETFYRRRGEGIRIKSM